MISPGKTIGVLGGGEHGRMFAQAAARLGYRVHVFDPEPGGPAGQVAHREVNAPYNDGAALTAFARECDVVTFAFENVPAESLRAIEACPQVHPHWSVLEAAQNQARGKRWLRDNKFPHAAFAEVAAGGDLAAAIHGVGLPAVVKTADSGGDGRGDPTVRTAGDVPAAVGRFAGQAVVVEQFIDCACEISAVVARSAGAAVRVFPIVENLSKNGLLDFAIVPARVPPAVSAQAEKLARLIAEKIGLVGVMGVEMFVTREGGVLVHSLVPRPPNSGNSTIDACMTSQFEQQVRAICGLPLGAVTLLSPVVMVNILGEAWARGEPRWSDLLAQPNVRLHLYGQAEPRPGRRMGHFTVTARDADMAYELAQKYQARLQG